jgi:hypothetical protein
MMLGGQRSSRVVAVGGRGEWRGGGGQVPAAKDSDSDRKRAVGASCAGGAGRRARGCVPKTKQVSGLAAYEWSKHMPQPADTHGLCPRTQKVDLEVYLSLRVYLFTRHMMWHLFTGLRRRKESAQVCRSDGPGNITARLEIESLEEVKGSVHIHSFTSQVRARHKVIYSRCT